MAECDRNTCDEPATVPVRYLEGEERAYCGGCWEELQAIEYLQVERRD